VLCAACGTPNPAGMRFCGMCGTPLGRQVTGRERRRVSVVFVDLAAFSTLTFDLDPEELRDLADEVLTGVAGIIEAYDGYVDAFQGDGLIALFGAPHSHPDDAQRAVLAATAGLRAIEEIGRARGTPLRGRAGVNTGIVIAGAVGSGRVRSYTVMGSAVNLAARLEEAAVPGEVWVGPETYEATRHRLLYEPTEPLALNGFPNVSHAYRLVVAQGQQQPDPYGHLAFVGRASELTALREAFDDVALRRRPREVWLVGEAGRGKTRLLREFLRGLDAHATAYWIESRPTEEFSWMPLAQQLFGLQGGEEERSAEQRVQRVLDDVLPNEPRWQRAVLGSLDLAPRKTWTRLERRSVDRTNVAWRDLLAAIAGRNGDPSAVVLVVENEPRDPNLLEFLALLQQAEAPILVLRSSRGPNLPADVDAIHLMPLSYEESVQLLDEVASPSLRVAAKSLVQQVGGVPAYVLELGRALSITQDESFSGSLASLLQSRLDMIDSRARRLLAQAALVGEATWEGLLRELAGGSEAAEVRELVSENLLVKQATSSIEGEVEYRFQSELLRNAVLRMIPFADRPHLHLRIATWLEQHAPLTFAELTAEHFERGGSPDAAYAHFMTAADLCVTRGDADHAFELFERLLGLGLAGSFLAEGALAYAQAAIASADSGRAERLLATAAEHVERCPAETRADLERVHAQLEQDLRALTRR
jgi:class 3 adenylate cyclase